MTQTLTRVKVKQVGGTWACGGGGDRRLQIVPSASRAAAMAQVKAAGDPVRTPQDCVEVYSDMATVTSSAGESGKE